MTTFIIKYCQEIDGALVEVTPDIAHIFRVFQHNGMEMKWVHDFTMLSLANEFIQKMRKAEIFIDEAFAVFLKEKENVQRESIEAVMDTVKQDIIRRMA
jgi:hypothetical protein